MHNKPNYKSIFVDCHVFDGTFQGTTTYLKGLYTEMVKNTNVQFYLAAQNATHLATIFGTAQNIHYLQYKAHNKFYRLLVDIPKMIKQHNIQYAHFQYVVPPFKYCKYITTLHDVLFMEYPQYFPLGYRIKNKLLFRFSAKRADFVLTVSDYSKQQIQKHFGISNAIVTLNAVDPIFFEEYNKDEAAVLARAKFSISNYWIYVSRWEPRKNHHRLLEVFIKGEYYSHSNLVFVGDEAITNTDFNMLYASLPLHIKQKVVLLNKINFQDLLLLVRGALLSIYPSVAEGFGIPPLEAAAANIPVACSRATAMSDFDFFGDTLFNPLDVNDMHQKIETALKGTSNTVTIKAQIKAKYNWATSAQNVYNALQ